MTSRRARPVLVALLAAGCVQTVQAADRCGDARLQLSAAHGQLHAHFAVEGAEGAPWGIVVVHEGRVAWRGRASPDPRGRLVLDRSLKDYEGADHVAVRAVGPRGRLCSAERTAAGKK